MLIYPATVAATAMQLRYQGKPAMPSKCRPAATPGLSRSVVAFINRGFAQQHKLQRPGRSNTTLALAQGGTWDVSATTTSDLPADVHIAIQALMSKGRSVGSSRRVCVDDVQAELELIKSLSIQHGLNSPRHASFQGEFTGVLTTNLKGVTMESVCSMARLTFGKVGPSDLQVCFAVLSWRCGHMCASVHICGAPWAAGVCSSTALLHCTGIRSVGIDRDGFAACHGVRPTTSWQRLCETGIRSTL